MIKILLSKFEKHKYLIFFLLSVLLGFVPLLWFRGLPIAGEEYYALDYAKWGRLFGGGWFNAINWGEYSPLSAFKFQASFFDILFIFGVSKYIAIVIWNVVLSVAASSGFYILLANIFGKKINPFYLFLATFYYLFTPFFLNISLFLSPPRILFAILPFIFLIIAKIYNKNEVAFTDLLLVNLILFIASPIFVNIPLGLVLLAVVILSITFVLYVNKHKFKSIFKILSIFTGLYLLLNIWWLFPTAYKQLGMASDLKSEAGTFVTIDKTLTVDSLSGFGSWAYREKISNTDYYYFPHSIDFDTLPGSLARYVPYMLVLVAYLKFILTNSSKTKSKDFLIYMFLAIHIIFLLLSKGTTAPFGFIYKFMYNYVPLFWMYREPYAKFMPLVAFTTPVLMAYSMGAIAEFIKARYSKTLIHKYIQAAPLIIITISVFLISMPFINGEIVWDVNKDTIRSYRIKIPDGWKQLLSEWVPNKGYYIQFPSVAMNDIYDWPSGYNGNPYLLLTDAKLINPESGYSSSENPQRRFITAYLYRLALDYPQKFVAQANRYNIAGLILQNDTVLNNYEYAFSVIEDKYKEFVSFNNENAEIFDVSENGSSLVSIYPKSSVLRINNSQLPMYHLMRDVSSDARLIQIDDEVSTDFISLVPKQTATERELIYDLKSANYKQDETLFLYKNTQNVSKIKLDGKDIPITLGGENYIEVPLQVSQDCCSTMTLNFNTDLLGGGSYPMSWGVQHINVPDTINLQDVPDGLLHVNDKSTYLAPLQGFDPNKINHIQFQIQANYNYPIGISIVEVDKSSKSTRYISTYKAEEISKPISIVFDGISNPVIKLFSDVDYYLAIYGMQLTDADNKRVYYPDDLTYVLDSVLLYTENIPLVFSLTSEPKDSIQPASMADVSYIQKDPSLILFQVPLELTNVSLLQLKNSYSSEWRLIKIDKNHFDTLSKEGGTLFNTLYLFNKAKSGLKPINIEYYSNAWEIESSDAGSYMAIVFWPTLIQELLYSASLISLVALVVFTAYKRSLFKKVFKK